MAIQTIDLRKPGGDTPRSANTKINQNFSNPQHAASRMVGTARGNIPEFTANGIAGSGVASDTLQAITSPDDLKTFVDSALKTGAYSYSTNLSAGDITPLSSYGITIAFVSYGGATKAFFNIDSAAKNNTIVYRRSSGEIATSTLYSDKNTTVDSNQNIKTSSPVVRVFADKIERIHEANDLPVKYTRNDVGDYTIKGTTGLRDNDWQIVLPEDEHKNQLVAYTIEDDNGTIRLKTYKRVFSLETFTFGPDLNTPLDIPEGRWVDLHFNDLPQPEEPETGV